MSAEREQYRREGWVRFGWDRATDAWARAAAPVAARICADPTLHPRDLRCGGTWFVGANTLPNGPDGAVAGVPLAGPAVAFATGALGLPPFAWDRGQVSVIHPGYPRHGAEETPAAFAWRRDRDGAHVDGIMRQGPQRRRRVAETHLFVLGVPLTDPAPGASPMVVWPGSHLVMQAALKHALSGVPPADWPKVDVTDAYQAARRRCLETLPRLVLPARAGESYLIHRLAVHGVAPWTAGDDAPSRPVAYFRPAPPQGMAADWWLSSVG
ncbi:MAG: hypothetical protein ACK4WC_03875 [Rubrimonas sp.]